jgi:hypothetical protein
MQDDNTEHLMYNVICVEKASAPDGMPGDDWYRYVLGYGNAKIEGLKPGTLNGVTQHAQTVADNLNERKDRRGSIYVSRWQKNNK